MTKQTMTAIGMALVAIAFSAPAAQAEIHLSDEDGALEAGTKVRTTSANMVVTRPGGTYLECAVTKLHLELTDAGTEHLELKQVDETTTFNCELNREAISMPNLPATIDDATIGVGEGGVLTINTWGTGSTKISFLTTIFADWNHQMLVAACTFEGKIHVAAKFETSDILALSPSALNGGVCGEGTAEGELTLETPESIQGISIHYDETG